MAFGEGFDSLEESEEYKRRQRLGLPRDDRACRNVNKEPKVDYPDESESVWDDDTQDGVGM